MTYALRTLLTSIALFFVPVVGAANSAASQKEPLEKVSSPQVATSSQTPDKKVAQAKASSGEWKILGVIGRVIGRIYNLVKEIFFWVSCICIAEVMPHLYSVIKQNNELTKKVDNLTTKVDNLTTKVDNQDNS